VSVKRADLSFRRLKETSSMLRSSSLLWVIWLLVVWVGVAVDAPAQGWVDRTGPNGPGALHGHAMCYDPVRGYVLLVGKRYGSGGSPPTCETWSWDGVAWTPRGSAPNLFVSTQYGGWAEGSRFAMTVHASTNEVLAAGVPGTVNAICVWKWDGIQWSAVSVPTANVGTSGTLGFACDPIRNQSILFKSDIPGIVLAYDGVTWSARTVTSAPVPLSIFNISLAMAFDPVASKIVMSSYGSSSGSPFVTRCYEWNGFGWNQRLPNLLPNYGMAAMSTDVSRSRIVGIDADFLSIQPNHTWVYSNGVFSQITTPVEPSLRANSAMAYDPVRGVHVLFGGDNGNTIADTWEFDLGPLASFTPYGAGCAGSRGVPQLVAQTNSLPRIGQTFTARTSNLPWTGPALMLVGLSDTSYSGTPLPADLSMLNAPGCFLRTSIDDVQPLQNVLGTALWSFVIPPMPGATFFLQAVPFDPAANPLNLTFSNGGRAVVGL
jgi:hypothetical protein